MLINSFYEIEKVRIVAAAYSTTDILNFMIMKMNAFSNCWSEILSGCPLKESM